MDIRVHSVCPAIDIGVGSISVPFLCPAATPIPVVGSIPFVMSDDALTQRILDAIAEDNLRDDTEYEDQTPNLVAIYRSAKL